LRKGILYYGEVKTGALLIKLINRFVLLPAKLIYFIQPNIYY